MHLNPIDQITAELQSLLSAVLNRNVKSIRYQSIHGGSINEVYRLTLDDNYFLCCKINLLAGFPGMFDAEASGLALIETTATLRVPGIMGCWQIQDWQVLVMEWIETTSPDTKFWQTFGEQLGLLHSHKGSEYGLDHDNYMGALPQANIRNLDWAAFFYEQRIVPQVEMAFKKGLITTGQAKAFKRLAVRIPDLFPDSKPALVHGDLWNGNFLCDASRKPVLIDPAVYYGDPAVDLAMTTLFGGFDKVFYAAYHYCHPLPSNHLAQWNCCNLYPLLVHLNLFGRSYLPKVLTSLEQL